MILEGRAGMGKSCVLEEVRVAYEAVGYEVAGLAFTNAVAQGLKADGFGQGARPWARRAATVHLDLLGLETGACSGPSGRLSWWMGRRCSTLGWRASSRPRRATAAPRFSWPATTGSWP